MIYKRASFILGKLVQNPGCDIVETFNRVNKRIKLAEIQFDVLYAVQFCSSWPYINPESDRSHGYWNAYLFCHMYDWCTSIHPQLVIQLLL